MFIMQCYHHSSCDGTLQSFNPKLLLLCTAQCRQLPMARTDSALLYRSLWQF